MNNIKRELPGILTKWMSYKNEKVYTVLIISNLKHRDPKRVSVVYKDEAGVIWDRPLSEWYVNFIPVSGRDIAHCIYPDE